MKTRYKYLGNYWKEDVEIDGEYQAHLINDKDQEGYNLRMFIHSDELNYDGIMSETNTSAIVLKMNANWDGAKLWRIW